MDEKTTTGHVRHRRSGTARRARRGRRPGPAAQLEVSAAESATPTYTVTFRNLTDGQWLTPPNWAAHDRSVAVFERNRPASEGVRAVAENGGVPVLAAELQAAVDKLGNGVSGVGATATTTWFPPPSAVGVVSVPTSPIRRWPKMA